MGSLSSIRYLIALPNEIQESSFSEVLNAGHQKHLRLMPSQLRLLYCCAIYAAP